MIISHHSMFSCGNYVISNDSVKSFVNWLAIVGSWVSGMTRFVSASRIQLFRPMRRIQRPDNSVKAATTVCETAL